MRFPFNKVLVYEFNCFRLCLSESRKESSYIAELSFVIWRKDLFDWLRLMYKFNSNLYYGMFHLKRKAHHKMETTRSNFFWHGLEQKKKIPYDEMESSSFTQTRRWFGFH
jgi:hypothetical protein